MTSLIESGFESETFELKDDLKSSTDYISLLDLSPKKWLSDAESFSLFSTYRPSRLQRILSLKDKVSSERKCWNVETREYCERPTNVIWAVIIELSKVTLDTLKNQFQIHYASDDRYQESVKDWLIFLINDIQKLTESFWKKSQPSDVALKNFPVLTESLELYIQSYWKNILLAHRRWISDVSLISGQLNIPPPRLKKMTISESDPHHGNQRVHCFETSDGLRVMYKPRNLIADILFHECIEWIFPKLGLSFYKPWIIDRGDYGWMEYIPIQGLTSESEAVFLFERCGALNAVLYLLKANDIHKDNVRFFGQYPVVIDAETLFHFMPFRHYHLESMEQHTLLSTFLLPTSFLSNGDSKQSRIECGLHAINDAEHSFPLDISQYEGSITKGFNRVLEKLKTHKQDLLNFISDRTLNSQFRHLARHTSFYANVLRNSYQPSLSENFEKRESFLNCLWMATDTMPQIHPLVELERDSIRDNDIPHFYRKFNERTLYSTTDSHVLNFFRTSCQEELESHFERIFSEKTSDHQRIISKSIAITESVHKRTGRLDNALVSSGLDRRSEALDKLLTIILNESMDYDKSTLWFSLNHSKGDDLSLAEVNFDIYGGYSGLLLLFSEVAKYRNSDHYTDVSKRIRSSIIRQMILNPKSMKTSFYTGLTGVIYSLLYSQTLWSCPSVEGLIEELTKTLEKRLQEDTKLDIISGKAGCILGLSKICEITPKAEYKKLLFQATEDLLRNSILENGKRSWHTLRDKGQTGFGHGNAGCAYALHIASRYAPSDELDTAIAQAVFYEDQYWQDDRENWADLRFGFNDGMDAWCNGSLGILGSRAIMNRSLPSIISHKDFFERFPSRRGRYLTNLGLCHGLSGEIEIMKILEEINEHSSAKYHQNVLLLAELILDNDVHFLNDGPTKLVKVDLFEGLSGIAYLILRSLQPTVTNVLF